MKKISLSIIIINYNTLDLTIDCIESIKTNISNISFEIIVINNYLYGNDYKILNNRYENIKNIKILKTDNRGFGSANNFGTKKARGKYLLFLNSDTKIIDNSIEKMVAFIQNHKKIGGLNPLLLYPNGTLQKHSFGDFQSLTSVILRKPKGENLEKNKKFFYRDRITGAALMLRKKIFTDINGFDENFFMYFEDEDLCRRLQKQGLKNAVLTQAKIIHFEGQSISSNKNRKKMYYQSQNYYWQKHCGYFMMLLMRFLRYPYILWQKGKNDNFI